MDGNEIPFFYIYVFFFPIGRSQLPNSRGKIGRHWVTRIFLSGRSLLWAWQGLQGIVLVVQDCIRIFPARNAFVKKVVLQVLVMCFCPLFHLSLRKPLLVGNSPSLFKLWKRLHFRNSLLNANDWNEWDVRLNIDYRGIGIKPAHAVPDLCWGHRPKFALANPSEHEWFIVSWAWI